MGEVLNKYISSVVTMEVVIDAREFTAEQWHLDKSTLKKRVPRRLANVPLFKVSKIISPRDLGALALRVNIMHNQISLPESEHMERDRPT